jgi:hypothetical protein
MRRPDRPLEKTPDEPSRSDAAGSRVRPRRTALRPGTAFRAGRWFGAIALVALAAVGAALVSQHRFGMEPCPWCVLQRLIFVGIAVGGADRRRLAARRSAAFSPARWCCCSRSPASHRRPGSTSMPRRRGRAT